MAERSTPALRSSLLKNRPFDPTEMLILFVRDEARPEGVEVEMDRWVDPESGTGRLGVPQCAANWAVTGQCRKPRY